MDTLGTRIRFYRRLADLPQHRVATAAGRSVGWLSCVENDLARVGDDDLHAIAEFLHVNEQSLRTGLPPGKCKP